MAEKRQARVVTQFKPGQEQGLTRPSDDPISLGIDGSIKINTAKLHPPKNVYDADVAWAIRRKPGIVSVFFAKEDLDDPKRFRTRVEIKYSLETFYHHLWSNSREFYQTLGKVEPLATDHVEQLMHRHSARDHSEWANFELISRVGGHACLDFFLLSPTGIARLVKGAGSNWLEATGVLRVHTTSEEVGILLNCCERIAAEVEPTVKQLEGQTT